MENDTIIFEPEVKKKLRRKLLSSKDSMIPMQAGTRISTREYDVMYKQIALNMAKHGLSDKEIAKYMGTTPATLEKKFGDDPEAKAVLDELRTDLSVSVERALYERCIGGKTLETCTVFRDAAGRLKNKIVVSEEQPSDLKAIMYWLSNVAPHKWGSKGIEDGSKGDTYNVGIFNTKLAEADLDRIRRTMGELVSLGTKQIESTVRDGEGIRQADSDRAEGQ